MVNTLKGIPTAAHIPNPATEDNAIIISPHNANQHCERTGSRQPRRQTTP